MVLHWLYVNVFHFFKFQGNIQRCQLITDQLNEVKSSMLKVLDHKQRITEIVQKHMSKRPIKKKERT